ncbi:hypothetical protein MASR1M32_21730 [Rhodobacter sp.]
MRNAETGEVLPRAAEVIACGSYAEMTPSGTGFRVLGMVAADHPSRHNKFAHPQGGEVEFYINLPQGSGRYITVTGNRVEGAPDALTPIDDLVARLWADVQPKHEQKAGGFDFNFDTGRAKGLEDLPQWARDFITHGGSGDRSANFQAVVNAMAARMDFLTALRILEDNPQGPAGKYAGRLQRELRRSWDKAVGCFTPGRMSIPTFPRSLGSSAPKRGAAKPRRFPLSVTLNVVGSSASRSTCPTEVLRSRLPRLMLLHPPRPGPWCQGETRRCNAGPPDRKGKPGDGREVALSLEDRRDGL